MKILFISEDLIGAGIAHRLQKEGNEVRFFIEKKHSRGCLDNILEKTENWQENLNWVGKEGLIIFDEIGFGKIQDDLRKEGYKVFGGCELGDKLEADRVYGQEIFKKYGLKTVELVDFDNIEDAVIYVKSNPKAWVIKQNGNLSKSINYVGHFSDGKDVISMLKNYLTNDLINREKITLQERIDGIEIAVGRYFNGTDWVGPMNINVEHKKLFPGDVGPMTSEMGTLAWLSENENNKLYKETLSKLKPLLKEIGFRGAFDINCIVNETGAYPLEATARMGSPIILLHAELFKSPWADFMNAVASGEKFNLKYKKGYGIVNLVATSPFPFTPQIDHPNENILYGVNIYFDEVAKEDWDHIYLEEVSLRTNSVTPIHYISGYQGYILYVTNTANTVKKAREKNLDIIKKFVIPKMFYRNDIGVRFETKDYKKLKKWGYLR